MTYAKRILASAAALALVAPVAASASDVDLSRVIVEYKAGSKTAVMDAIQASGGIVHAELDAFDSLAVEVTDPEAALSIIDMAGIASIEFDPIRSMGPVEATGHTNDPGVTFGLLYGLDMVQADQMVAMDGTDTKVCVIDSGYDHGHVDLPFVNVTGEGDKGSGPWNGPNPEDLQGRGFHGTHVAGTIAAIGDNGVGVAGVVTNAEETVGLHIVRVFDAGGGFGYASDLAGAINDCVDAGANIVNMSLGGKIPSKLEERAFERAAKAGVLNIASAGNDGIAIHSYPASYDSVMGVAAIDDTTARAGFSTRNAQVEVAAPGVDILSTFPRQPDGLSYYAYSSGTSMAAPHVAGVAALVRTHHPECSASDLRDALRMSAMDLGEGGRDYGYGFGVVQAKAASDYLEANGCSGKESKGQKGRGDR